MYDIEVTAEVFKPEMSSLRDSIIKNKSIIVVTLYVHQSLIGSQISTFKQQDLVSQAFPDITIHCSFKTIPVPKSFNLDKHSHTP